MAGIRTTWNNHFGLPALPPAGTFKGQTILITGASSGLGLATAVHFVNLGAASVIITARSDAKGKAAKEAIEASTHTAGKGIVKPMVLDMSTFSGTKQFADEVIKTVPTIDYVLLNAGILNRTFKLGQEGFEETNQIHVLSTTLLALLLLPWMMEAGKGKAHLAIPTSSQHTDVPIGAESFPKERIFEFFNVKENYPAAGMYPTSKLFAQYVTRELAKLATGPDGSPRVIVNGMCPGLVNTELSKEYKTGLVTKVMINALLKVIAKPVEGGARTFVLAALIPAAESGRYYTNYLTNDAYEIAAQKAVFGPDGQKMQAEMWKEILAILTERVPEIKKVIGLGA